MTRLLSIVDLSKMVETPIIEKEHQIPLLLEHQLVVMATSLTYTIR